VKDPGTWADLASSERQAPLFPELPSRHELPT
jgi:hypothetical protein